MQVAFAKNNCGALHANKRRCSGVLHVWEMQMFVFIIEGEETNPRAVKTRRKPTYIYIYTYIILLYTYNVLSVLLSLVLRMLAVHVLSVLALDVLSSMF